MDVLVEDSGVCSTVGLEWYSYTNMIVFFLFQFICLFSENKSDVKEFLWNFLKGQETTWLRNVYIWSCMKLSFMKSLN